VVIESANAATERPFAYRRRELIGRNVRILMPQPQYREHDEYLRRYMATGQARIMRDERNFKTRLTAQVLEQVVSLHGLTSQDSQSRRYQQ